MRQNANPVLLPQMRQNANSVLLPQIRQNVQIHQNANPALLPQIRQNAIIPPKVIRPIGVSAVRFSPTQFFRPPTQLPGVRPVVVTPFARYMPRPVIVQPKTPPKAPLLKVPSAATPTTTPAVTPTKAPPVTPPITLPEPLVPVSTVYVGRIPPKCEDIFLKQLLAQCGMVSKWTRISDPESGQLKSFGFCEFATPQAALRALRILKYIEIDGNKLLLNVDNKTKKTLDEYKEKVKTSNAANNTIDEGDDIVIEQIHLLLSVREKDMKEKEKEKKESETKDTEMKVDHPPGEISKEEKKK